MNTLWGTYLRQALLRQVQPLNLACQVRLSRKGAKPRVVITFTALQSDRQSSAHESLFAVAPTLREMISDHAPLWVFPQILIEDPTLDPRERTLSIMGNWIGPAALRENSLEEARP